MTTVRELLVSFGLDFDGPAFARADSVVKGLATGAKALVGIWAGSIVVDKLRDVVVQTVEAGAAVDDFAQKTGIAAGALQELQYAAQLSGVSQESLKRGLTTVAKLAGNAATGTKEAADSFARYGIRITDASGKLKTGDVLLGEIADKMHAAKGPTERLTMATEFFGAKNSEMAILLKGGSAGLAEMRAEAQALGVVMDDELIAQTAALDDQLDRVRYSLGAVKKSIAAELIPLVADAAEAFLAWWKANKKAVAGLLRAVGVVARATVAFVKWLKQSYLLKAVLIALGAYLGTTFLAALGSAAIAAFSMAAGMNAWAAAALLTKLQMIALQAVALAKLAAIGAVVLTIAIFVAMLGEEIAALFDDKKIGLFERMQGKWDKLRDSFLKGIGGEGNPILVFIRLVLAYWSQLIHITDQWFNMLFRGIELVGELAEKARAFFGEPGSTRAAAAQSMARGGAVAQPAITPRSSYDAAAAASLGNLGMSPIRLDVHVDATGGGVDGKQLGRDVARPVGEATKEALAQAHRALTPALAR